MARDKLEAVVIETRAQDSAEPVGLVRPLAAQPEVDKECYGTRGRVMRVKWAVDEASTRSVLMNISPHEITSHSGEVRSGGGPRQ
jgi:hypothetical protein